MWVVKDKDAGVPILYKDKPIRDTNHWRPSKRNCDGFYIGEIGVLPPEMFKELKWEDEPLEVSIIETFRLQSLRGIK